MKRVGRAGLVAGSILISAAACSLITSLDGLAPSGSPQTQDGGSDQSITDAPVSQDATDAADASCVPVDAATDPKNCGRCGHDCLGGTCSNGVCQPVVLTTPDPTSATKNLYFPPCKISTDGVSVCWSPAIPASTEAFVFCVPVTATNAVPTLVGAVPNNGTPGWIPLVVRAGTVTAIHDETNGSVSILTGNPAMASSLNKVSSWNPIGTTDAYRVGAITADDTGAQIFFGRVHQDCPSSCTYVAEVGECKGVSCTVRDTAMDTKLNFVRPQDVFTDGVAVYWTRVGIPGQQLGEVHRYTLPPNVQKLLVSSTENVPVYLGVDGANLYWTTNGGLRQSPAAGGSPVVDFAAIGGPTVPLALGAIGGNVFTSSNDPNIYRYSETGDASATPYVIGVGQDAPTCMTHDKVALYWIDGKDATVRKVALP